MRRKAYFVGRLGRPADADLLLDRLARKPHFPPVKALLHFDGEQATDRALGQAQTHWQQLTDERPLCLYGAALCDESLVLGAYQRPQSALDLERADGRRLLRRRSGGAALSSAPGLLYLALGLRQRSLLMSCPPLRILNRNVRGFLRGLRDAGFSANYFGRDFLSIHASPVGYVGWDAEADGRVLVELFLSMDAAFALPAELDGYPQRREAAYRGREPTTLAAASGRSQTAQALFDHIARAHVQAFNLRGEQPTPGAATGAVAESLQSDPLVTPGTATSLRWSEPAEEAIGFVQAGVAIGADGRLCDLALAGDFMMSRTALPTLRRTLLGEPPEPASIGAAIDATFKQHELEGVRSLKTLQQAIVAATGKPPNA